MPKSFFDYSSFDRPVCRIHEYDEKNTYVEMTYDDSSEAILSPDPLTNFFAAESEDSPIQQLYDNQQRCYWFPGDIDWSKDHDEVKKKIKEGVCTESTMDFIRHILAFFANSDGLVLSNAMENALTNVTHPIFKGFIALQIGIEQIHSQVYKTGCENFSENIEQYCDMIGAIRLHPAIAKKNAWASKWMSSDYSFGVRLFAFAIVEGIFFAGSFCAIYWLKSIPNGPNCVGLFRSNELINRDEGLHVQNGILMFRYLRMKPHVSILKQMIQEAVDIEFDFIDEAIKTAMIGMNRDLMKQYIRHVANHLWCNMAMLPDAPFETTENPFDFMDKILAQNMANFFSTRPNDYTQITQHTGIEIDEDDSEETSEDLF
jgi:ribonucleotide reductase beta subunit family protein with ferritin-like domain